MPNTAIEVRLFNSTGKLSTKNFNWNIIKTTENRISRKNLIIKRVMGSSKFSGSTLIITIMIKNTKAMNEVKITNLGIRYISFSSIKALMELRRKKLAPNKHNFDNPILKNQRSHLELTLIYLDPLLMNFKYYKR